MKSILFVTMFLAAGLAQAATQAEKKEQAAIVALQKKYDAKDREYYGIKQAKKDKYVMRDCPIAGNINAKGEKIFHTPKHCNYNQVLEVNKCVLRRTCKDQRKCFETPEEAVSAGFRMSQAPLIGECNKKKK